MTEPTRIYAVGDIHGQLDMLRETHERIAADLLRSPTRSHAVVHIGDYVDRGPDSRGVLDSLIEGEARGAPWINLMGNHDRLLLKFLANPRERDARLRPGVSWLHPRLGGAETLRSYGLAPSGEDDPDGATAYDAARAAMPEAHRRFLASLPVSYAPGDWFFAHAGIRPGVPLEKQTKNDLIWIRDEFLEDRSDHGPTIIHGHTPVERVEDHGNRIAIDTGAAYGGPLSTVVLEGVTARVLGGESLR